MNFSPHASARSSLHHPKILWLFIAGLHLRRFKWRHGHVLGKKRLGAARQQRHCHPQWRLLACGRYFGCSGKNVKQQGLAFAHSMFSQKNNLCSWGSCVGSSVVSQCLLTPANVIGLSNNAVAVSAGNVLALHTPSRPPPTPTALEFFEPALVVLR